MTGKEFGLPLVQIALTPLFMLFIFAKVPGSLNYMQAGFGDLLLPGIAALGAFLTALQSVAYPSRWAHTAWSSGVGPDRLPAPDPKVEPGLPEVYNKRPCGDHPQRGWLFP